MEWVQNELEYPRCMISDENLVAGTIKTRNIFLKKCCILLLINKTVTNLWETIRTAVGFFFCEAFSTRDTNTSLVLGYKTDCIIWLWFSHYKHQRLYSGKICSQLFSSLLPHTQTHTLTQSTWPLLTHIPALMTKTFGKSSYYSCNILLSLSLFLSAPRKW